MSEQGFNRFVKVLEEKIDTIAESIAPLAKNFAISSDDKMDPIDRAGASTEQFIALRLHERCFKFERKVGQVASEAALKGIGICRNCGQPISAARLEARPMTVFCLDCKTSLELEEKRKAKPNGDTLDLLWLLRRYA